PLTVLDFHTGKSEAADAPKYESSNSINQFTLPLFDDIDPTQSAVNDPHNALDQSIVANRRPVMIDGLKQYTEYKNTGLLRITRVPTHWALIPNRAVLRKRKVLVGGNHKNYQLLSLTKGGVVVRDISTGKGKFSSDMGTSQEVRKGDIVFCLFDVPET